MTGLQKLFDFLKPQFFDNFVAATKVISGYNPETYYFKTSSLPLHMGTSLKQVCDVATKMSWNCEISSLALKNLNERKYQKTKLLPLTEDVMKFQKFLNEAAKRSLCSIKGKPPDQIIL
ncbi:hypothetical protein NQ318_003266 [Aromia moschata]|uniref:Uncharacterized protein n=1 Tax=Aromia moschata TaxID=1265417 RepID=A0AAV8XQ30_9CUCU|nr:hypothetical protein NQ318_003266 [Aromia moschata]